MRWKPEDVRAFLDRDWAAFERAPVVLDPAQSEALAGSLYDQVRAAVPNWPTPSDRDQDLIAHLRLVEIFSRISRAKRRVIDPR
ncbi:MAG TPA: hypothetical protein VFB62_17175 [Polyangiaceae bacterium]|nr:hypothetical protein [Polyangiaceae bacterium]